jgi:hypothetical protein
MRTKVTRNAQNWIAVVAAVVLVVLVKLAT